MNRISTFLFACVFLAGLGCSTTSRQSEVNQFSFHYNDALYSIISIEVNSGNPVNYLIQREADAVLLRARDNNLDGVLDTLLVGNISLTEANEIYFHGIAEAVSEGKYRRRQLPRVYYHQTEGGYYAIQSYERSVNAWYNRFIVHDAVEKAEVIFLDRQADGTLDQIERGEGDLKTGQALYEVALEAGMEAGQIVRTYGSYVVEPPA